MNLPDALWGDQPTGARRLGALVRGLPADSATFRAVAPAASWTISDELLATLIELTDARWGWFFDVHAKPNTRRPSPLRIPRPGQTPPPGPDDGTITHGHTSRPRVEVVAYLRRFAPPREEVTVDG